MWLCGCCDPSDAVDELQVHAEVIAAVPIFNDPAQGSAATLEESRVENEGVEGPTGTQERLREDVRHLLHILAQEGLDVICRKSQNGEIARQTDVRPTDAGSTDERRSAEDIDWNPGIRGRIFVSADCEEIVFVSNDKKHIYEFDVFSIIKLVDGRDDCSVSVLVEERDGRCAATQRCASTQPQSQDRPEERYGRKNISPVTMARLRSSTDSPTPERRSGRISTGSTESTSTSGKAGLVKKAKNPANSVHLVDSVDSVDSVTGVVVDQIKQVDLFFVALFVLSDAAKDSHSSSLSDLDDIENDNADNTGSEGYNDNDGDKG